jgi:hypothetical protein
MCCISATLYACTVLYRNTVGGGGGETGRTLVEPPTLTKKKSQDKPSTASEAHKKEKLD